MKEINIRQMRASFGRLDELVAAESELVISRRGRPIARVLCAHQKIFCFKKIIDLSRLASVEFAQKANHGQNSSRPCTSLGSDARKRAPGSGH
jgi:antitoxin (DNA-binding transcriptional repressor) of toxin-antitoxin stability system